MSKLLEELNVYPPGTRGWFVRGDRWSRWWEPGIILGRVNGHRRVVDQAGEYWFMDVGDQFSLIPRWLGKKHPPHLQCRI